MSLLGEDGWWHRAAPIEKTPYPAPPEGAVVHLYAGGYRTRCDLGLIAARYVVPAGLWSEVKTLCEVCKRTLITICPLCEREHFGNVCDAHAIPLTFAKVEPT